MSTPEQKGNKAPEWSIFNRIDELEKISLELMEKTETVEPALNDVAARAKDNLIVATYAYGFAFTSLALQNPQQARKRKDDMVNRFKRLGLSAERLKTLSETMTFICDSLEE